MKQMRTTLFAVCQALMAVLFFSCGQKDKFTVEGVVTGANEQVMYLETVGVSSFEVLDSVKLTPVGKFEFEVKRPAYPDFYRLRLNDQLINFAVDSTETIKFMADANTFATSYIVEGSENCKAIKEITLAQLDANQAIQRLRRAHEKEQIADTAYQREVLAASEAYKAIARKYIYSAPMSTAAYFALFQQIDGLLFFDLYDKEDSKAYGAVATSYDHFYPESPRSKHLYNLALQSIKVIRAQQQREQAPAVSTVAKNEVGYVDIQLPNLRGETVNLSSVAKGKTVLVNFTAYMSEWSPALNMDFRELYDKYRDKGFEIYQISLDSDLHFWKNAASNLPWVCVRDPQSVYSQIAGLYNVKQLPAIFILDKKGNLVKRIGDLKELDGSIRAAL